MSDNWPIIPVKYYTTEQGCSCPQWRYRPWARPCKHVVALRAAQDLLEANAAKWAGRAVDNCKPDPATLEADYA